MKYIVIEEMKIEVPIVFSELLSHHSIALGQKVISAGFCSFGAKTILGQDSNGSEDQIVADVSCWGESVTLKVKSRLKEDEELILKHNEFRG